MEGIQVADLLADPEPTLYQVALRTPQITDEHDVAAQLDRPSHIWSADAPGSWVREVRILADIADISGDGLVDVEDAEVMRRRVAIRRPGALNTEISQTLLGLPCWGFAKALAKPEMKSEAGGALRATTHDSSHAEVVPTSAVQLR